MPINSFLVLGVMPANNEQQVPVNTNIRISFSKHMDISTLTETNIKLRKVNGESIPFTFTYNRETYQLFVKPVAFLEGNVQYQVELIGGTAGIKSVTGDYTTTRTYEFNTVLTKSVSQPRNLALTQSGSRISAKWDIPTVFTEGQSIIYNVRVSASNDPANPAIWPLTDAYSIDLQSEQSTAETSLAIPYDFELKRNYYVMVRAVTASSTGDWTVSQVYLEDTVVVAPPSGGTEPTAPTTEQIEIVEVYPTQGSLIEDNQIFVIFSDKLDTLPVDAMYVVQAPYKEHLSMVDVLTKYSPSKAIAGTVSVVEMADTANELLQWVATEPLPLEKEYTLVISKDIKGQNSDILGIRSTHAFRTPWTRLYGDIQTIKESLGSFGEYVSDSFIYDSMNVNTQFAYDTASNTASFELSEYQNGNAPYYIHQYVNLQTAYDVLLNTVTSSGGSSKEDITLGVLHVAKESNGSNAVKALSKFKLDIKPWLDMVHGHRNRGYAKPGGAVKGERGAAYPEFFTRTDLKTNFDS